MNCVAEEGDISRGVTRAVKITSESWSDRKQWTFPVSSKLTRVISRAHPRWSILNTLLSENEGHPPLLSPPRSRAVPRGTDRHADKTITIKRFHIQWKTHLLQQSVFELRGTRRGGGHSSPPPFLTGARSIKWIWGYKCFPEPSPSLGYSAVTHSQGALFHRLSLFPPTLLESLFTKLCRHPTVFRIQLAAWMGLQVLLTRNLGLLGT